MTRLSLLDASVVGIGVYAWSLVPLAVTIFVLVHAWLRRRSA